LLLLLLLATIVVLINHLSGKLERCLFGILELRGNRRFVPHCFFVTLFLQVDVESRGMQN
jgi:hypothetical protein